MSTLTYHHDNVEKKNQYLRLGEQLAEATREGDQRRIRRLKARQNRVAEEVIESNAGLAVSLAQKVFPVGDTSSGDADDYVQTAKMYLWEAFCLWEPEKASLSHFAYNFIKGGVGRNVRSAEMSHLSYDDYTARPSILEARRQLSEKLDREATAEEIASKTGQPVNRVRRVLAPAPVRLDERISGEPGDENSRGSTLTASDNTEDEAIGPGVEQLIADGDPATLARYLDGLPPAALWVLVRRYGIDGAPPQLLNYVAWDIAYGRQKVHRLWRQAINTLIDRAG